MMPLTITDLERLDQLFKNRFRYSAHTFTEFTVELRRNETFSEIIALAKLGLEIPRLRQACAKENEDICQLLGQALGYPWFKDDQENFPGATEENGVCVGDHVAVTLAMEAARKLGPEAKGRTE